MSKIIRLDMSAAPVLLLLPVSMQFSSCSYCTFFFFVYCGHDAKMQLVISRLVKIS